MCGFSSMRAWPQEEEIEERDKKCFGNILLSCTDETKTVPSYCPIHVYL